MRLIFALLIYVVGRLLWAKLFGKKVLSSSDADDSVREVDLVAEQSSNSVK